MPAGTTCDEVGIDDDDSNFGPDVSTALSAQLGPMLPKGLMAPQPDRTERLYSSMVHPAFERTYLMNNSVFCQTN